MDGLILTPLWGLLNFWVALSYNFFIPSELKKNTLVFFKNLKSNITKNICLNGQINFNTPMGFIKLLICIKL